MAKSALTCTNPLRISSWASAPCASGFAQRDVHVTPVHSFTELSANLNRVTCSSTAGRALPPPPGRVAWMHMAPGTSFAILRRHLLGHASTSGRQPVLEAIRPYRSSHRVSQTLFLHTDMELQGRKSTAMFFATRRVNVVLVLRAAARSHEPARTRHPCTSLAPSMWLRPHKGPHHSARTSASELAFLLTLPASDFQGHLTSNLRSPIACGMAS